MRLSLLATLACLMGVLLPATSTSQDDASSTPTGDSAAASEMTNAYCPVLTDEPIDPKISVEYEGRRVLLCCRMCRRDFLADPVKYLPNLPQFASIVASPSSPGEHANAPKHDHDEGHEAPDKTATAHPELTDESVRVDAAARPSLAPDPHDHTTGHASDHTGAHYPELDLSLVLKKSARLAAKFHPIAVHFPIAMVFAALLAELLTMTAGESRFRPAGRFCMILAAAGALVAAPLGWAAAAFSNYPTLASTVFWHRWLGTTGALFVVAATIAGEVANRREARKILTLYRVLLVMAVLLIGVAGHLGATLIYGPGFLSDL